MEKLPEELEEWILMDTILKLKKFMHNEKLLELITLFDEEFNEFMEGAKTCKVASRKDYYHKTRGTAFLLGMAKLGNECYFCETHSEGFSKEENLKHISALGNLYTESKIKLLNLLSNPIL